MNKEDALKLARDRQWNGGLVEGWTFNTIEQLLAFANSCEKIGMEKAANICMGIYSMPWHDEHGCSKNRSAAIDCAEAIRAHKE